MKTKLDILREAKIGSIYKSYVADGNPDSLGERLEKSMQTYADQEVSKAIEGYKERLKEKFIELHNNSPVYLSRDKVLTLIDSTNGKL